MKKIIIFLVSILMLTSCKEKAVIEEEKEIIPVEEMPEEVVAKPQSNKAMNVSMRLPTTMNPLLNEDETVATALRLIFENIITIDEYQNPSPNIIEDYHFSEDGKSITLTMRKDVFWHDGEILKASDIEYSINVLRNAPETVFYKKNIRNISSTSINEGSITIHYHKSKAENVFMLDFPIIPRHFYETSTDNLDVLGNGAYKFSDHVSIREIDLVKNENFFKGTPLIDLVKIIITPDIDSDMNAFEQGVIDVISTDIVNWGKYRGDKETEIYSYTTNYYDFIGFNFKNPVFEDIGLRKAIAHSIPKDDIVKSVYLDYATKSETPINPTAWFNEATLSEYTYDLKQSRQLLSDTAYTEDDQGTLSKKSGEYKLDFVILVNEGNLERVAIADIVKTNFSLIGIKSEVTSLPFEEYMEAVNTGEFDIIIGGYNLSIVPDLTFMLHSSSIATKDNIFSYKNETLDQKLENAAIAKNEIMLKDSISDLQLYMIDELPCISLAFRKSALLTDKSIYGELNPTVNDIFNNVNEWFISQ